MLNSSNKVKDKNRYYKIILYMQVYMYSLFQNHGSVADDC